MGTEFRARSKVEEYLERQQTYGDSTIGAVGVAEEHRPQVCPTAANKTIRASERRSGLSPSTGLFNKTSSCQKLFPLI